MLLLNIRRPKFLLAAVLASVAKMLQQAMKRLMPAGLLQGQAAIATKLGLETPLIKQQQQQREQHAGNDLSA